MSSWILVEERLPEIHEQVLVYMPNYSHIAEDCVQVSSLAGKSTFSIEIDCGPDGRVTHWQPLPAPPETANAAGLCAQCGKLKNDSTMHHDAPGTNWGAALHWFQVKER
jgi:hypothetical protein